MKAVWTVVPDTERGGKMVNGSIVGPSKRKRQWIVNEVLVGDKVEAKRTELSAEFNRALYDALQINMRPILTKADVIPLVREHAAALKDVLQSKRYASFVQREEEVPA